LLILEIIITVVGGLALICLLVDWNFSAPLYRGPITNHFNGKKFLNLDPAERKGFFDFLRWQLTRKRGPWNRWTDSQPGSRPVPCVTGKDLRVTFINHATVLIQTEGLNILTDPIWSERASPLSWAGPKRHRSPGLKFEDLPPIDIVLVSHNHYDHLDIQTLLRLHADHHPRFVIGLGNLAFLTARGINDVVELDWWEVAKIADELTVTCVPAKHFSGRGLSDGDATLWCGYVIQASSGNVYFAGDTALGSHFIEVKRRFRSFRLVLLPIGAYLPRWFMHPVHLSPNEAVEAHHILEPRVTMAMHFGTFALGDDGELEPVHELREALNNESESNANFWVLVHGEAREVPQFL
jgi:L-ascorbate metabolism protein UlaG (beta-lactamase superfamily)